AARGMLLGLRNQDADAVEPLERACTFYRRRERQPRLFVTLIDLVRAGRYGGQLEVARRAYDELKGLEPRYPGLAGLVLLLEAEMQIFDGDLDGAVNTVRALREEASRDAQYPWTKGLDRAERLTAQIQKRRT